MRNQNRSDHYFVLRGIIVLVVLLIVCVTQVYAETTSATGTGGSAADREDEEGLLRTVPFITLRNKTGEAEAEEYFGSERSILTAGYCDVSRTPIKPLESIAENAPFYIPDEMLDLAAIREEPPANLWREVGKTRNGRRPLLYTHGYHVSFERGCKRASMFQQSLGLKGRFMYFSWPSDGAILNYTHDEADVYWSVAELQAILTQMGKRFGAGGFDVVAHSLGTRGVFLALGRLAGTQQGPRPLINQLVLVAPDIDADIFEQDLPLIRPLVGHMTIYVSSNDKPLVMSRQVHGYPRLGEAGPHLQRLRGVEVIDVSDVGVHSPSGHVYHLYHREVVSDLDTLINDDKPASQRAHLMKAGKNLWRLQPQKAK